MRALQRIGVGITLLGVLLVMAGGMHVRNGPDGTWVQWNVVHGLGGVAILIGTVVSLVSIARNASNSNRPVER